MDITDVNVKLVEGGEERLKASCTVIIDGEFVIRDVKVIEGTNGLFVAMPSRKLMDHCPRCRHKNHLRARYCNHCGQQLNENRATQGRSRSIQLHAEVAHPINSGCRTRLQTGVLAAYEEALNHARSGDRRPPRRREEEFVHEHDGETDSRMDGESDGEAMGGYNDLISELKSEAKQRRGDSDEDYRADSDERDIDGDRFDLDDDQDEVDEVDEAPAPRQEKQQSQAAAAPAPQPPAARPAPPPAPVSRPAPAPAPAPSVSRVNDDDDFGAGLL